MTHSIDQLLALNLKRLQSRDDPNRLPIEIDQRIIGSVVHADAQLLATNIAGVALDDDCLVVAPVCSPDAPAVLQAMANTLREHGRCQPWRNEALPVMADDGTLIGSIERACVRALGIRTFAVHCVGFCARQDQINNEPTFWLQRRAADKAVDPGMLDTLAGGLIGMESPTQIESFQLGMAREIHEEAGLTDASYDRLVHLDSIRCRADLDTEGYFEEDCIVYQTVLWPGVLPKNQDGEVSEFLQVGKTELIARISAGDLTETASIASLLALKSL